MGPIHIPHPELTRTPADLSRFWVIVVLTNPIRYKRRYELTWRTIAMLEQAGVNHVVVEEAFGNRPHMVTSKAKRHHLQLRGQEELWLKERAINLGARHVSLVSEGTAREIAWIDGDCRPAAPYRHWFEETWHQLQHFEFVQMWQWAMDIDVNHNPIGAPWYSFMNAQQMSQEPAHQGFPTGYPHGPGRTAAVPQGPRWGAPGLAWAANLEAFNKIGGIPDYAVLGAGDWYLAHMLASALPLDEMNTYSPGYRAKFQAHQDRINRWIKGDVGCVPGLVLHDFHGSKKYRFYQSRERILIENAYDPNTDLKEDAQGMYQLESWEPRQLKMRDLIRGYFRARNEDSIEP